jgi:hypothetical protein
MRSGGGLGLAGCPAPETRAVEGTMVRSGVRRGWGHRLGEVSML